MRATASVWLLVALSGCGPKLPPLPTAGGPAWIELTSAHFEFYTDASQDEARRVLQMMEDVRSVIYGVVFSDQPAGGHTIVIAMRGVREVSMFTWPDRPAYAAPPRSSPLAQPLIVMAMDAYRTDESGVSGARETATHELAHALSSCAIRDQPAWFAEGLATYFQTIKIDGEDVELGRPPSDVASSLARGVSSLWPIASVFSCKAFACKDWVFYERAWALFAYLRNTHPRELVQLGQGIDDRVRVVTWKDVLPDLPIDRLDRVVSDWLISGNLSIWNYKLEHRVWPVEVRVLSDAEVLSLRAVLWRVRDRDSPEVDNNITSALARDPNDLLANYLFARIHQQPTIEHAHEIVRAHPKSWIAWRMLGDALREGPQAEFAWRTMCDLVARDPAIDPPAICRSIGSGADTGSGSATRTGSDGSQLQEP